MNLKGPLQGSTLTRAQRCIVPVHYSGLLQVFYSTSPADTLIFNPYPANVENIVSS